MGISPENKPLQTNAPKTAHRTDLRDMPKDNSTVHRRAKMQLLPSRQVFQLNLKH